jgi:hypothetical protein
MRLYKLEIVAIDIVNPKSDSWSISYLSNSYWHEEFSGSYASKAGDLLKNLRLENAVLELGFDRESKPGTNIHYYLVRDMWPERTIEELTRRICDLEWRR